MTSISVPMGSLHGQATEDFEVGASRSKKTVIWLMFLFFSVLSLQLFTRISIIENSYELEQQRSQMISYDERLRELRFEYAAVNSAGRLALKAQSELKMGPLTSEKIRKL